MSPSRHNAQGAEKPLHLPLTARVCFSLGVVAHTQATKNGGQLRTGENPLTGSGTDPVVSPSRHNATPCVNPRVVEVSWANQMIWTGDTSARLWGLVSGGYSAQGRGCLRP